MRIHLGSGSVYLKGYVNVDLQNSKTHLASSRADLVEKYETTEDKYYGRHEDKTIEKLRVGPLEQEYVCDKYGSFFSIPCGTGEAKEVLARQCFEHLSITEARKALDEIEQRLAYGGVLRLDVPDGEATLQKYRETGDKFYVRHLLGPRNSDYGYHMMGYTKESLKKLVEEHGLIFESEESNIHFYPAFCFRFRKPGARVPYEYFKDKIIIEKEWKVLEIGPGAYPFPRADVYADHDMDRLDPLIKEGKKTVECDLNRQLPFEDKEFDYVYCSHVFEHVKDPFVSIREINRVGKRGVIIVPSAFKEFLFNWEEGDHKWWFFRPELGEENILKIMKQDAHFMSETADSNVSAAFCHMLRTGPNRIDPEYRLLRRWFYEREKHLDVCYVWEGEAKARLI